VLKAGVDVGGTFTGVVFYAGGELRSAKVLTDPRALARVKALVSCAAAWSASTSRAATPKCRSR